jgi:hypothetical protein
LGSDDACPRHRIDVTQVTPEPEQRPRPAHTYRGADRRIRGVTPQVGYRGPDRRSKSLRAEGSHPTWYAALAAVVTVVCLLVVRGIDHGGSGLIVTFTALRDTGAGLFVLAGTVMLVLWALTGRAARVLDGSALLLTGGGLLILAGPWSALMHHAPNAVLIAPAARLILGLPAFALIVTAGRMSPVHSAIRPRRVLSAAAAGALGVLVIEAVVRQWGPIDRAAALTLIMALLSVGWMAVGLARVIDPSDPPVSGEARLGWALVGFGLGDILLAVGIGSSLRWAAVGAVVQLIAAAAAAWVAVSALTTVLGQLGGLRLQLAGELNEVANVLADEQSIRRSLVHDARNVVMAIRTANLTLERHGERLEPQLQEHLQRSIGAEFGRLQDLLGSAKDHAS